MKIALNLILGLVVLIMLVGLICYAIGARLPINHSATVTGAVDAPPEKVFALITDISSAPSWRKAVKSVQVLPPVNGPHGDQDHWIEDLGHGTRMNFLATQTMPPSTDGHALRVVLLQDVSYGGTWTYRISPGPTPTQSTLEITEDGYINPPIFRFMMAHIFGMTRNLDQYMHDIQAAATRS